MKRSGKILGLSAAMLASMVVAFTGCSQIETVSTETKVAKNVVGVNDGMSVDTGITKPFGVVADTSVNNKVSVAWGHPGSMPSAWYFYIDGNKVAETTTFGSYTIENVSAGNHTVGIAAVVNGRRSEVEGIDIKVNGTVYATSSSSSFGNDLYTIVAKCSNKALDVAEWSTTHGTNIHQWGLGDNQANQQWRFEDAGDGYVAIVSAHSGFCLDVDWGKTEDGVNVLQYDNNKTANQLWKLEAQGNGYYKITNKNSGKVLDVSAASTEDGANVQQWTWNGSDAQLWKVEKVGSSSSGSAATLYQDINYGGNTVSLPAGDYNLAALQAKGFKNDDLTSIKVASGYTATLFWDDNFTGATKVVTGDVSWIGNDWNDKMSSIKIYKTGTSSNTNNNNNNNQQQPVYNPGLNGTLAVTEAQAVAAYAGLAAPKDSGYVAFTFENNTNGKFKNNEIFIVVLYQRNDGIYYWGRPDGSFQRVGANEYCDNYSYTIEDNNGTNGRRVFNIPKNTNGARIFYSYGSKMSIHGPENGVGVVFPSIANPGDPDYNKYYDWLEYTIRNDGVTWVNTTQVDQFGFPALITAYASNGSVRSNGDGLFTQTGVTASRDEVYAAYYDYMAKKGVANDFNCLAETYRIVCPGKSSQFNKGYLDSYINEVWNYWATHQTEVKHAQGKFILSGDGNNLKFYCTESYNPAMCQVGQTYYVYGKPSTEHAFEGAGCLATDTKGNGMEPALQAWVCAALNRGVATRSDNVAWGYTSAPAPANYASSYYQGGKCNYYSGFWHSISTNNGLAYGFCYDDVHEQSSTTVVIDCQKIWIRLGF